MTEIKNITTLIDHYAVDLDALVELDNFYTLLYNFLRIYEPTREYFGGGDKVQVQAYLQEIMTSFTEEETRQVLQEELQQMMTLLEATQLAQAYEFIMPKIMRLAELISQTELSPELLEELKSLPKVTWSGLTNEE